MEDYNIPGKKGGMKLQDVGMKYSGSILQSNTRGVKEMSVWAACDGTISASEMKGLRLGIGSTTMHNLETKLICKGDISRLTDGTASQKSGERRVYSGRRREKLQWRFMEGERKEDGCCSMESGDEEKMR